MMCTVSPTRRLLRNSATSVALLAVLLAPGAQQARAELRFGVVSANLKVRPGDSVTTETRADLIAARNEFEPFQIVFSADETTRGIAVDVGTGLKGPDGATIGAEGITLYREAYYRLSVASNNEGGPGRWPDPLIPHIDPYVGERRNAFPFEVPAGETRVVWVDILVPREAPAGWYEGNLSVTASGESVGTVPVRLHVGDFELPSTASLRSAYAMDYAQPCMAHTGYDTCDDTWNEPAALELRERYIRAGLEHRITIHDPFFQPPLDDAVIRNFERYMLGHIDGTGTSRLPGAKLTSVRLQAGPETFEKWITYAKSRSFYDRLFYYPIDEPAGDEWDRFRDMAAQLRAVDEQIPIILTTPLPKIQEQGLTDTVDIAVVEITLMENPPGWETGYGGPQRHKYDPWLQEDPKREVWTYQSCTSHGCGDCGEPSTHPLNHGWPNRVIDSSAVQDRAHAWFSFMLDSPTELYYETVLQLDTAWDDDGQCAFSGSGDGTLFYPGRPDIIGGQSGIPITSMRMKLIRESMEDYEYLVLVARKDKEQALQIARDLFPHVYESAQPPEKLESARAQLFALLVDGAPPPPPPNNGGNNRNGGGSSNSGGSSVSEPPAVLTGSCELFRAPSDTVRSAPYLVGLVLLLLAVMRRARRRA
jgi:hypothetical protein